MPRVLYYVQHLVGLGHDARAAAITRELVQLGAKVTYVTGGFEDAELDLSGARYVTLPPLKASNPSYETLVGDSGKPPDATYWARRSQQLRDTFENANSDVLIVETFPFGRWPFREELLPLLDRARSQCLIVCSIRDILEPKSEPTRNRQILEFIDTYFDLILVHGDPNLVRLRETFPDAETIADKTRYTGYVCASPPPSQSTSEIGRGEIIVSAGGGATCGPLMTVAVEAARLDRRPWRFLIGPNCPAEIRRKLFDNPDILAENVRPDFCTLLCGAAASISQAGYNTATDILTTGVPALIVPHQQPGQNEQWHRAQRLAERGFVTTLREDLLTPQALLQALDQLLRQDLERPADIDLTGASTTAHIIASVAATGNSRDTKI
ncbi:MAG: glycosyl transferase [Rhodospirillaceae bacterium]|nr:glycosyl transferase [Rhodospirillaceae bacterium]